MKVESHGTDQLRIGVLNIADESHAGHTRCCDGGGGQIALQSGPSPTAPGAPSDARRGRLIEDVVRDNETVRSARDEDLAVSVRIGEGKGVVEDVHPPGGRADTAVAVIRPAARVVVEDVVANHHAVAHRMVDAVVVVLPVGGGRVAALLSGAEPPDVVNDVLLDDQVADVGGNAPTPAGAVVADAADVVYVVPHDRDIMGYGDQFVAGEGIDAAVTQPAHLEALDPDVIRPDPDAVGRPVVPPVHDRAPAMGRAEQDPIPCRAAPADREDRGASGIDAVAHEHAIARIRYIVSLLQGAERQGARARVGVIALGSIDVAADAGSGSPTPRGRLRQRSGGYEQAHHGRGRPHQGHQQSLAPYTVPGTP